jgi:hypothetical protein
LNTEQKQFQKVIKARKVRRAYEKRLLNRDGWSLPIGSIPEYKSKKYMSRKKKSFRIPIIEEMPIPPLVLKTGWWQKFVNWFKGLIK